MQSKYLCVLFHIWIEGEVNRLKPCSNFFTDRSKAVLLLWIFYAFFSVLCLLCLCARLFICALWSPAGKGLNSWLSFVVSNCEFVTFPLVSWVRDGTWLYRFLIFAPLLTESLIEQWWAQQKTSIRFAIPTMKLVIHFKDWHNARHFLHANPASIILPDLACIFWEMSHHLSSGSN